MIDRRFVRWPPRFFASPFQMAFYQMEAWDKSEWSRSIQSAGWKPEPVFRWQTNNVVWHGVVRQRNPVMIQCNIQKWPFLWKTLLDILWHIMQPASRGSSGSFSATFRNLRTSNLWCKPFPINVPRSTTFCNSTEWNSTQRHGHESGPLFSSCGSNGRIL